MKKNYLLVVALVALVLVGALLPASKQAPITTREKATAQQVAGSAGDYFTSPAGIVYGKDWSGKFESRVAHIMAHTKPDASKLKHSVFIEKEREGVLALLDEAWKKRGPPKRDGGTRGRDVYDVPMGRVVGTAGERSLRLVVEPDSAKIVTAYPAP